MNLTNIRALIAGYILLRFIALGIRLGVSAKSIADVTLSMAPDSLGRYWVTKRLEQHLSDTNAGNHAKYRLVLAELYWKMNYYRGALLLLSNTEIIGGHFPISSIDMQRRTELLAMVLFRCGRQNDAVKLTTERSDSANKRELLASFLFKSDPQRALELLSSLENADLKRTSVNILVDLLILFGDHSRALNVLEQASRRYDDSNLLLAQYQIAITLGKSTHAAEIARKMFAKYKLFWPDKALLDYASVKRFPDCKIEKHSAGLVSVIMTTFNSADYVEMSINSILRQTYNNIEVIVVDDASTDGRTLRTLERLCEADSRISLIKNSRNLGTYGAKNKALAVARGQLITFHDSDDWAHPQRIERQANFLGAHRRYVACQSQWIRIDWTTGPVLKRWGSFLHTNPASLMIRRDIQEHMGRFDTVRIGADTEYVARIRETFGSSRFKIMDGPLTFGTIRSDALTNSGVGMISLDGYNKSRVDYWAAWLRWHIDEVPDHSAQRPLRLERNGQSPFPVPPEILPDHS